MPVSIKILFVSLLLLASLANPVRAAGYPVGDLSRNCEVNLEDLKLFAGQWLEVDLCCASNPATVKPGWIPWEISG